MRKLQALMPLLALLLPAASLAHYDKAIDLNGGHYDDFGNYHCHRSGCERQASRNERRSIFNRDAPADNLERRETFLEEEWPHWELVSGCLDARNLVLQQTSRGPVSYATPRNCTVRQGEWVDEYSGEVYTFAPDLEVDHIIPPLYANGTNGYQWDQSKRRAFANDPLNLIPVSRASHRRKSERSISRWQPRDEFRCDYAIAWREVSEKYDLDLETRDRGRMNSILRECEEQQNRDVDD